MIYIAPPRRLGLVCIFAFCRAIVRWVVKSRHDFDLQAAHSWNKSSQACITEPVLRSWLLTEVKQTARPPLHFFTPFPFVLNYAQHKCPKSFGFSDFVKQLSLASLISFVFDLKERVGYHLAPVNGADHNEQRATHHHQSKGPGHLVAFVICRSGS